MDYKIALAQPAIWHIRYGHYNGLDILSEKASVYFARFRDLELAFTIKRLRELKID